MLTTEKINELIGVNDSWKAPEKLLSTISELNNYLCDTELTADNFTSVEEIDND